MGGGGGCVGGGTRKKEWEMSYINKAVMKMKTEQPHLTLQSHQPCSGFEYNMKDNWMKTIPTRSDNISRQSLMVERIEEEEASFSEGEIFLQ